MAVRGERQGRSLPVRAPDTVRRSTHQDALKDIDRELYRRSRIPTGVDSREAVAGNTMTRQLSFVCLLLSGCGLLPGQNSEITHNNISVGVGAGIPVGNSTNYLATAPLISVGYGYRFNRLFQADIGFQAIFGAAHNQNAVITDLGTVQGGDHEFMIPLGGRIILPTQFSRVQFSAGGGVIYLHYSETAPSNAYYSNYCYTCTSRSGWGGYGLANGEYFLDSNHTFHVGLTLQYVAASTNGQPVANIPAINTTDHWMNVFADFGLSF